MTAQATLCSVGRGAHEFRFMTVTTEATEVILKDFSGRKQLVPGVKHKAMFYCIHCLHYEYKDKAP